MSIGIHLRLDIRTNYLPSTPNITMKLCEKMKVFCSSPARKLPRRRRAKKFRFFAPLPNDIWSWRKIASTEVQLWLITYWQSLTISNLILSPNYVVVWPTWSIFSFKNKIRSKHHLCKNVAIHLTLKWPAHFWTFSSKSPYHTEKKLSEQNCSTQCVYESKHI